MITAQLVFQDDKSNKFWNIETNNDKFITTWGRIGTIGQAQQKQFYDNVACEKEAKKIIASKIKKGYVAALTEELITETFIKILSGVAEYKAPKEMYYRDDKFNKLATIEFVNGAEHIILRHYYDSGQKKSEHEWVGGKQNGNDFGWYEDGRKHWERKFVDGRLMSESRF